MSRTLNRCWQTAQKLVFNHANQLSNVEFKPNQVKYVKNSNSWRKITELPFYCVIDVIILTMRITSHIYVMDNKAGDSKHFNNRRPAAITLNVTSSWAPIRSRIKCLIWAQWNFALIIFLLPTSSHDRLVSSSRMFDICGHLQSIHLSCCPVFPVKMTLIHARQQYSRLRDQQLYQGSQNVPFYTQEIGSTMDCNFIWILAICE